MNGMEKSKHIYLIRHGESRANATGLREGGTSPLTTRGEQQAEVVAQRFKSIPIEVVLSSPYKRAFDTGKRISEVSGVGFEVVDMAYERKYPSTVEGLYRDNEVAKAAIATMEREWVTSDFVSDGEHFNEVLDRVKKVSALIEQRSENHIAVTAHDFFIKFFVAHHLLGEYLTAELLINQLVCNMRGANTGITYFTVTENKKWHLMSWNDHAHLGEIK